MRRPMKDPGILLKTEARYSSRVQQPTRPMAILSSQPHPYWPAQLAASKVGPVPTDQKVGFESLRARSCFPGRRARAEFAKSREGITGTEPGRRALSGLALQRQGHPKIVSAERFWKRSSGPTLDRRRPADPAGLTARAKPEAHAANLSADWRNDSVSAVEHFGV